MATASSARNAESLRVHLLGAFRVERGTKTLRLSTRKVESLFAFLALHPQAHAREKLAALFWGDSTDEQARHSLRTALATIRKELGDEILIADRETVQLNPDFPLWVDAREIFDLRFSIADFNSSQIENQKSKIANYAGDLLPDLYDDWIPPEREQLRAIYIDALLRLAQHHRAKSEYARAIEFAQKVLTHDPANEKAYQHLIFCRATTGDRIGALKQYDECVKQLRDELGVEPSRETSALCAQIQAEMTGGQSREALLTNLPVPLSSFVGRQNEIAEVKRLLETSRLVTLIGAGGCGKTRLAIQVGTELAAGRCFKNGVWWVDLSALQDPAHVAHSVAMVFDLHESENLPLVSLLTNYLRTKELLLMLDNCEQVIDACMQLVGTLLPACPQLRVLATSRERLNASGEFVWYVPSMAVPPTELPLDQLRQYDAIQLFSERARAVQSRWSLAGNGAAVTHICAQLDGIPLAIELAAARLNVLSAEQINARLADRFNLLTGGSRTEMPRHQTLRAAIDWSYDLLSDAERAIFRQLAVFAGGWTLEAAEAILSRDALDYLTTLIDKSLVVVEQKDSTTRYRLLETVRQYAREKLETSSELKQTQDRHLDYFLKLAEQAKPTLAYGDPDWLNRLEIDYDNIRAALEHSLATDAELALRLMLSLEWFWEWHGRVKEGYGWVTRLLPLTEVWEPGKLRARALYLAGSLAGDVPDREAALVYTPAGLEMAKVANDKPTIAWSLYNMAVLAMRVGEWEQMRRYAEESRILFEELGIKWGTSNVDWQLGSAAAAQGEIESARLLFEQSLATGRMNNNKTIMTFALGSLGLARRRGDYKSVRELYSESLQILRQIGHNIRIAFTLRSLGQIALHENDPVQARALILESLPLYRLLGEIEGQVYVLAGLAGVAGVGGKYQLSAQLFAAAEAAYEKIGSTMSSLVHLELDPIVEKLHQELDQQTLDSAWQIGRKMMLEQALEYALENVK